MAMSQEHKDALAQGRIEARAIRSYLEALPTMAPGRRSSKESLESRIATINGKIGAAENPLKRVELIQSRLEAIEALQALESSENFEELEAGFTQHARAYSLRKGISYTAWRELGVPAATVKAAGIAETRRR